MTPDSSDVFDADAELLDASMPPPGAWLKRERLAKGVEPEQVCAHLGITRHRFQMLEDDEYTRLPAEVYVRGWIRRYCSMLDIPAGAVLASFEEQLALLQRDKLARQQVIEKRRRQRTRRFVAAAAGAVMVAAAGVSWQLTTSTPDYLELADVAIGEAQGDDMEPRPVATMPPELLGEVADAGLDSELGQLEVRLSSDSWVEVLDAKGNILVADLKSANEVLVLQGMPPFEVYVANAPGVQVRYRGEVLELAMTPGDQGVRTLIGTDTTTPVSSPDES